MLARYIFPLFFLVLLALPHTGLAQSAAGVRLQPSLVEESVEPGATLERSFTITNLSDAEQVYYFQKRDISGVGDGGSPIFAEEGAPPTGFELSTWVTLPEETVTLQSNQATTFSIRIDVPEDASPGSHFGGIFVSVDAPRLRQTGAAVGYDVGAIISLRIAGDVVEGARMREFSTDRLIYSRPNVEFLARVENPGNVLIRPRGPLEVFNMFGKRVGILTINDSLAGVFPGTTRDFDITWQEDGLGFGRYQAVVGMVYGEAGRQSTVSGTVSFWILPAQVILPILGGLAFIVLVAYISIRLYIRRTLQHIEVKGDRRRVVSRRRRKGAGISQLAVVAVTLLASTALFLIFLLILFA